MADFPNHSPAVSTLSRNNDGEIPYASLHSTADRWKATAELLRSKGDSHGAASAYAEAVSLNPGNADLHRDLGTALMEAGDRKGAIAALCEAVRLQPNVADSYVNLGVLHYEEGSLQEAIACEEQALALNPALGEACNNLGIALRASGRLAEAEDVLRKAIALDRGFGPAHYNLGCTLFDRWELDNAESAFREALALMPGSPAVHTNLGHTLFRKGNNDSAIECYRKAITLQPDFVDAHWNLSHALLLRGDVTQGWAEFEWRWRKPEFRALRKSYPFPEWDGRYLPTVHSWCLPSRDMETFSTSHDIFLFSRRRECGLSSTSLLKRQIWCDSIPGVDRVVVRGEQLPAVDACCGLMSLPYLLGEPARSLPIQVPYLKVAAQKQKFWEQRFQASASTLRVGVVWSGSMTNPAGRYRSMQLQEILPLLETNGIQFYSLQKSTGSVSQDSGFPRR